MNNVQIRNVDVFFSGAGAIVHQANCFHTMGAGIARIIKRDFPEAFHADLKTPYGSLDKLGTFSKAKANYFWIYNLYSQYDFGTGTTQTDYESFSRGFEAVIDDCIKNRVEILGVPYNIGCGLAGGNWSGEVYPRILKAAEGKNIKILICKI